MLNCGGYKCIEYCPYCDGGLLIDFCGSYGIGCCCANSVYQEFREPDKGKRDDERCGIDRFKSFLRGVSYGSEMPHPYGALIFFKNIIGSASIAFEKLEKKKGNSVYSLRIPQDVSDTIGENESEMPYIIPAKVVNLLAMPSYPPAGGQNLQVWNTFKPYINAKGIVIPEDKTIGELGSFVEFIYNKAYNDPEISTVLPGFTFSVKGNDDLVGKFIFVVLYLCHFCQQETGKELDKFTAVRLRNYFLFIQALWETKGSDWTHKRSPVRLEG